MRIFLSVMVLVSATLVTSGCEYVDAGELAVTWRFNGHAAETGDRPCGGIGADRIVIEMDGPEQLAQVVACDYTSPDYPLSWLGFAGDLTVDAYGYLMRDLPTGRYDVRVFFIDQAGEELADPPPQTSSVRIERGDVSRLDFDFQVTTGALRVRWRIADQDATCEEVGAAEVSLIIRDSGSGALVEESARPCGDGQWTRPELAPGTYEVSGQLLDGEGSPITRTVVETDLEVTVANPTSAILDFAWESFTVPLSGPLRYEVGIERATTSCDAVTGLASGPLSIVGSLLTADGTPVVGAWALPNPDGHIDCADLTGGEPLDGVTLAPCPYEERIVCGLQVGNYTLAMAAMDASDLVCYEATEDVTVGLSAEEPLAVVLEATDATGCWE